MQGFDSSNPDLITVRYVHGSGSDIAVDRRRVFLPGEPSVRSRSRATITGGGAGGGQQGSGSGSRDDNLLVQQRTAEARSERIKTLAAEAAVIKLDDLTQHPLALTRAPQTESRRLLPPVSLAKARSRAPRNNLPSGSTHVDLFNCFLCQKQGLSPPLRRCSQCEIAYYFRT